MERESTAKKIYMERYDIKKIENNILLVVEGIGYLKCFSKFFPDEEWVYKEMEKLTILLLNFTY